MLSAHDKQASDSNVPGKLMFFMPVSGQVNPNSSHSQDLRFSAEPREDISHPPRLLGSHEQKVGMLLCIDTGRRRPPFFLP